MGVEAVTSGLSACTDRGALIGYVIGISMPDAEIYLYLISLHI